MAKKSTTKRSTTKTSAKGKSKKVSSGKNVSGLNANVNLLSWKVIVPVVLLFAAVGGYFVWQSNATSYRFIRRGSQISSGDRSNKNGVLYHLTGVNNRTPVKTFASRWDTQGSSRICAHYKNLGGGMAHLYIEQIDSRGYLVGQNAYHRVSNSSGNICLYRSQGDLHTADSTIKVWSGNNCSNSIFGIDTIYGR